jgi:hypothetical protein
MIPSRFEPFLFGLILSGLMSFVISGISTLRATGLIDDFPGLWIGAWLTAWLVAFPMILLVAPFARQIAHRLVKPENASK